MIKANGFIIFENEKEWERNYKADWRELCHCIPIPKEKPTLFPVAYQRCIDCDPYSRDSIVMIPMEEAKQGMIKYCEEEITSFEEMINAIKQI